MKGTGSITRSRRLYRNGLIFTQQTERRGRKGGLCEIYIYLGGQERALKDLKKNYIVAKGGGGPSLKRRLAVGLRDEKSYEEKHVSPSNYMEGEESQNNFWSY